MKTILFTTYILICSVVFSEPPNSFNKIDEEKKTLDNIINDIQKQTNNIIKEMKNKKKIAAFTGNIIMFDIKQNRFLGK